MLMLFKVHTVDEEFLFAVDRYMTMEDVVEYSKRTWGAKPLHIENLRKFTMAFQKDGVRVLGKEVYPPVYSAPEKSDDS